MDQRPSYVPCLRWLANVTPSKLPVLAFCIVRTSAEITMFICILVLIVQSRQTGGVKVSATPAVALTHIWKRAPALTSHRADAPSSHNPFPGLYPYTHVYNPIPVLMNFDERGFVSFPEWEVTKPNTMQYGFRRHSRNLSLKLKFNGTCEWKRSNAVRCKGNDKYNMEGIRFLICCSLSKSNCSNFSKRQLILLQLVIYFLCFMCRPSYYRFFFFRYFYSVEKRRWYYYILYLFVPFLFY